MGMTAEEAWVDVEVVAAHLSVNKDSVYRWVHKQGFPAHRIGRLLRFRLSEVDQWVKTTEGTSPDTELQERIGKGLSQND